MADDDRDQLISSFLGQIAEMVAKLRRDREQRLSAGDDTAAVDQLLAGLEPVAEQAHDLDVLRAIHSVVGLHGAGPYPVEDLASIASRPVDDVRRVLDQMVTEDLAERT